MGVNSPTPNGIPLVLTHGRFLHSLTAQLVCSPGFWLRARGLTYWWCTSRWAGKSTTTMGQSSCGTSCTQLGRNHTAVGQKKSTQNGTLVNGNMDNLRSISWWFHFDPHPDLHNYRSKTRILQPQDWSQDRACRTKQLASGRPRARPKTKPRGKPSNSQAHFSTDSKF